jgi:NAD(P)-dependent dehydrogenase (short-subunit alcohol dehydrogenase family)
MMQTPSFRVDGKRALITGGSRGIGLASALALALAGAKVVIAARRQSELEQAAVQIRAAGGEVEICVLDVSDPVAIEKAVSQHGPFQILVNNAGGNRPGYLADTTDADIDAVMRVNVNSAMNVSRAVVRGLVGAGLGGSIINLSSQLGHIGGEQRTLYSAAKHAVEGFTKSLAWEVGRFGIRVNAVAPSLIETDMTQSRLAEPGMREMFAQKTALGRIGQPEDLMGAVVFLASDASSFVTGTSLRVDGGTTAV